MAVMSGIYLIVKLIKEIKRIKQSKTFFFPKMYFLFLCDDFLWIFSQALLSKLKGVCLVVVVVDIFLLF